ncbi:hypothetical protein MATR_16250 [Marivirga tractuosa]|uniref:Uncharacterized protein n=1 Tax=Marivirga tractuosa (strain ATCC 23168 / DSM 4126 / NBRC 15989 / NCIMB 1408 / VKM B-1430 / H-43) TaxID=643867 RepID=E4TRZ8_MARTH|nr:hypothetical protein [Marivirga tractuosa]ADR20749.1 hypothetical protein Ftrac_0747 [Marivirga tractuosa DSM 4126]BDD14800.1 hypothetical protein MATR_16250 [Marivirga tractuosa]
MSAQNPGFDAAEIDKLKQKIAQQKNDFVLVDTDDNNDEYKHFRFTGMYEGKEVIYDAVIYTLRLHHASEVYELAEHKAAQKFPNFKPIKFQEDENGDLRTLDNVEEEIGLYIAEMIDDIEDEELVKVQEHVDMDNGGEYGIGLDIGLNVEEVDDMVMNKFVHDFNEDNLKLDDTLYSFVSDEEEYDEN